jgi:hypothetical protein
MSHNPEDNPDFEALLQNALGIKLAKVKQSAIKFSTSQDLPNARVIRRTTVISVIEKRGKLSNLSTTGGLK